MNASPPTATVPLASAPDGALTVASSTADAGADAVPVERVRATKSNRIVWISTILLGITYTLVRGGIGALHVAPRLRNDCLPLSASCAIAAWFAGQAAV